MNALQTIMGTLGSKRAGTVKCVVRQRVVAVATSHFKEIIINSALDKQSNHFDGEWLKEESTVQSWSGCHHRSGHLQVACSWEEYAALHDVVTDNSM
jgi:hypothetical protein